MALRSAGTLRLKPTTPLEVVEEPSASSPEGASQTARLPISDARLPISEHVRVATPALLDPLMQIAFAACEENGFLNYNPTRLLEQVWACTHLQQGLIGVIEGPKEIEGVVVLRVGTMWYSDDPVIEEKVVWVHPSYRKPIGYSRAQALVNFSKHVSDFFQLPLIIGVLSNSRTKAKVKLYERLVGEPSGAFFLYNGHTGDSTRGGE